MIARLTRPIPFFLLVLLPALALYAWGIDWGAPSGWAYDEISPRQLLTSMSKGLAQGWPARYPPFHYYLLAPPAWALLQVLDRLGTVGFDVQTALLVLLRLVSVAMATATVAVVYRIARLALDRASSLLAAIVAAVPVTTVYYAKTANLEVPYLFWFAVSLLGLFRLLVRQRLGDYLLFTVCAALAVATKDQIYGFYVLAPAPILVGWWRHHAELPARRRALALLGDRRLWLSVAAGLAAFALAHGLPFDPSRFVRHFEVMTGPKTAASRMYAATLGGHLRMLWDAGHHVAFGLGLPLSVAGIVGVVLVARDRRRRELALLGSAALLAAGYYLFFVAVVRFHLDRYFMPVVLVLALFAGRALATLARWPRLPAIVRGGALAAILGWAVARGLALDLMMVNDSRTRLGRAIQASAARSQVIGVGARHDLPPVVPMPWDRLTREGAAALDARGARYVVVNATHARHGERRPSRRRFYADLIGHRLPYRRLFAYRWRPPLDPLGLDSRCFVSVRSNLCWINPELVVFERVGEAGGPALLPPP